MATILFPSSFRCDCGHESHFCERTIREIKIMSRRKPRALICSEEPKHEIEFDGGEAVTILCPEMGRRAITGTE